MINIELVEQHIYFIFEVNGKYYRVSFEHKEVESDWAVRLIDVEQNKTVYSQMLSTVVIPDVQLAQDMVKTYILRE
jgi:hypothetical protein